MKTGPETIDSSLGEEDFFSKMKEIGDEWQFFSCKKVGYRWD